MNQPKNTWYCSNCKFFVFNSKQKCKTCLQEKPNIVMQYAHYDPEFEKEMDKFYLQTRPKMCEICAMCKLGVSHKNCWKYT
jgi:hypothetical protein